MKRLIAVAIAIMIAIISAGCSATGEDKKENSEETLSSETRTLLVFSGAGLKKPMDEIGKLFEEKYGVKVQYSYAGSGQQIAQMELTGEGDVFVPGSIAFYEMAKEKGLVDSKSDIAYHIPVIIVPKENPAGINTIEDLSKPGVKLVIGDSKATAIGKVGDKIFEKAGMLEGVYENVAATTPTVNELVTYVSMNQADASMVWEDNAEGVEAIRVIEIPKEQNIIKTVPASVVSSSENKELAQKFVEFVVSEEGKAVYEKYGFKPVK